MSEEMMESAIMEEKTAPKKYKKPARKKVCTYCVDKARRVCLGIKCGKAEQERKREIRDSQDIKEDPYLFQ